MSKLIAQVVLKLRPAVSTLYYLLISALFVCAGSVMSLKLAEAQDALAPSGATSVNPDLVLHIDFEDSSVSHKNKKIDGLAARLPSRQSVQVPIYYEAGGPEDRFAKVVPDPASNSNHVLQFWLKNAKVPGQRAGRHKGRIQLSLSDMKFTEAYQRYRIYLSPDLKLYRANPKENSWFTINELWFGASWKGDRYPFRITLGIAKEKGADKPLLFTVSGDKFVNSSKWQPVWAEANKQFEIPIGEWLDVELGYKQGDKRSGRFYLAVKRESDTSMTTLFDIHDWTYNPDAPAPVPLTSWQPLKLYTSGEIIDYINNHGGVAQLYFDDLKIYKHWAR
jgi:hypothetical protein